MTSKYKITSGFVTQIFNDNNVCIEQNFTAGDPVEFEDEKGNSIDSWSEYQTFDMVQPGTAEKLQEALKFFEWCIKTSTNSFKKSEAMPKGVMRDYEFHRGLKLLKGIVNG